MQNQKLEVSGYLGKKVILISRSVWIFATNMFFLIVWTLLICFQEGPHKFMQVNCWEYNIKARE